MVGIPDDMVRTKGKFGLNVDVEEEISEFMRYELYMWTWSHAEIETVQNLSV